MAKISVKATTKSVTVSAIDIKVVIMIVITAHNIYFTTMFQLWLLFLPVNCLWNNYSAWSVCNKDCGGGTKHRSRTVFQQAQFGGEPCKGGAKEEVACNETPCAGKFF